MSFPFTLVQKPLCVQLEPGNARERPEARVRARSQVEDGTHGLGRVAGPEHLRDGGFEDESARDFGRRGRDAHSRSPERHSSPGHQLECAACVFTCFLFRYKRKMKDQTPQNSLMHENRFTFFGVDDGYPRLPAASHARRLPWRFLNVPLMNQ